MSISTRAMRRGLEAMILLTVARMPSMAQPLSRARMPMMVSMQLARAVATRSVGENASPLPRLSTGASVMMWLPERRWTASVRRSPV